METQNTKENNNEQLASLYSKLTMDQWQQKLTIECNVFQCSNKLFLVRTFDSITFYYCDEKTAKSVLHDNLISILKYNYFLKSPKYEKKIKEIVNYMTTNFRMVLYKLSLNNNKNLFQELPVYCLSFKNGVYDFKNNKWLFKYKYINIQGSNNNLITYTSLYIIRYYINIDFQPFDFSIMDKPFHVFLKEERSKNKVDNLLKIFTNLSHDRELKLNIGVANGVAKIFGYMLYNKVLLKPVFVQTKDVAFFYLLNNIFNKYILPKATSFTPKHYDIYNYSYSLLENHYHNIVMICSKESYPFYRLENLCLSPYQTIDTRTERYNGFIYAKQIFFIDQFSNLKIPTSSPLFSSLYIFVSNYNRKTYNSHSISDNSIYDDFDYSFNLKDIILFIYISMYGIKKATNDFNNEFEFKK